MGVYEHSCNRCSYSWLLTFYGFPNYPGTCIQDIHVYSLVLRFSLLRRVSREEPEDKVKTHTECTEKIWEWTGDEASVKLKGTTQCTYLYNPMIEHDKAWSVVC